MKISVDRLCRLAGVESPSGSRRLTEGSNRSYHDEPYYQDEADYRYGSGQLAESDEQDIPEGMEDFMAEDEDASEGEDLEEMADNTFSLDELDLEEGDPDEVLEVDERELVQELRRAKRLMRESRRLRAKKINERSKIDRMIDEEVANVIKDYNISGDWVYGKNRPTFSRPGRVTTSFPGIGFGKKW